MSEDKPNLNDELDSKNTPAKIGARSSEFEIEARADIYAHAIVDALDKGKKKGDIIY